MIIYIFSLYHYNYQIVQKTDNIIQITFKKRSMVCKNAGNDSIAKPVIKNLHPRLPPDYGRCATAVAAEKPGF